MAKEKDKTIIPQGKADLPPPGDERREVLAEREDKLQEAAEKYAEDTEMHAVNPDALKVENELAQHFDFQEGTMLAVTNKRSDREYIWGNHICQHGTDVTRKQAMGWKVVSGADKECDHIRAADGTRRIGDLLLMWTTPENKARLDNMEQGKRDRIYGTNTSAVDQEISDMVDKHPNSFIMHPTKYVGQRGTAAELMGPGGQRSSPGVQEAASKMLGDMVRAEIPGVPIPGRK